MKMKFNIRKKNVEITEKISNYTEEKIGKLEKYLQKSDELTANILIKENGKNHTVEVTIPAKKFILRAEETNKDVLAAIDIVSDKLERQIRKVKTKKNARHHKLDLVDFIAEINVPASDETTDEEVKVVKRKSIEMKPMSEEEAILQMELLGHEFFIYNDIDSGNCCVIYFRKDGNYGIIETN